MIVFEIFCGTFLGTFIAVDLALVSLVLPNAKSTGQDSDPFTGRASCEHGPRRCPGC
jgi:hypothetical protein